MIIDTHCHYNLSPLYDEWPRHWQAAQEAGIIDTLVVGADLLTSQRAVEIASQEAHLYAAVGIHPDEYTPPIADFDATIADHRQRLRVLITDRVKAIGETGLDYFRLPADDTSEVSKSQQQAAFIMHLQLAEEHNLPISVHVRDKDLPTTPTSGNAYWDTLTILKQYYHHHRPFILHCVSGPQDYLREAIALGGYIGVAGNVTYKNADAIRHIVEMTQASRVLVETDAPFLPPTPFRGQVCEPRFIVNTAAYLSENFGIPADTLTANAKTVLSMLP